MDVNGKVRLYLGCLRYWVVSSVAELWNNFLVSAKLRTCRFEVFLLIDSSSKFNEVGCCGLVVLITDLITWSFTAVQAPHGLHVRKLSWATSWQNQQNGMCAWRKLGSLATHWAHSEDCDQTGRMPRLIWVFAARTVILLVLSWGGSVLLVLRSAIEFSNQKIPYHDSMPQFHIWF